MHPGATAAGGGLLPSSRAGGEAPEEPARDEDRCFGLRLFRKCPAAGAGGVGVVASLVMCPR